MIQWLIGRASSNSQSFDISPLLLKQSGLHLCNPEMSKSLVLQHFGQDNSLFTRPYAKHLWFIQKRIKYQPILGVHKGNKGFPSGSDNKESSSNAGDPGSIPGSGRSPGEGNGYPLQYSWLENPMDRGARRVTAHRVTKSWTRLSN